MQRRWVNLLPSIVLLISSASASDVAAKLRACASESNDSQRLVCYDALAAESANHSEAAPAKVDPERTFGNLRTPQADQPRPLTQITSTVVKVDARPNDRWAVTLENSQVWEQNESDTRVSLHPGDVVTIKKGTMSSHLLAGPSNVATYVRRVR